MSDENLLVLDDGVFQKLCKDLLRSGEISSDGELSEIARREVRRHTENVQEATKWVRLNVNTWIKEEPELVFPINPTTGTNPCTEEFLGSLGLEVTVPSAGTKSKEAHFSQELKKIYINQNRFVNIEFKLSQLLADSSPISGDLFIRCLCVYLSADDFIQPVKVCFTHSRDSSGQYKSENAEHLVRCNHPASVYHLDPNSMRHSVVAPFPEPQPGSNSHILAYKFMDLGSCSGGLNRRETALIFTLEDSSGTVIGRRVLQLRICTCPKRDYEQELKNREKALTKNILRRSGDVVFTYPLTPDGVGGYTEAVKGQAGLEGQNGLNAHSQNGQEGLIGLENGGLAEGKQILQGGKKRKAYWVLAYDEENYSALKNMGMTLERKDGGDVSKYIDVMTRFNGISQKSPKKPKP